jgi:hypothetical protein
LNFIEQILTAILKFVEGLVRKDQTSEDAKRDPALRDRLRDRIDKHEQRLRNQGDPGT